LKQNKIYDVVILGGGLAGMCLALQLINSNNDISILILEKRKGKAPPTTHKIGESSSELGAYYINDKLGLRDYLLKNHMTKVGTRFYYKSSITQKISERVEISPEIHTLYPTVHLDRGIFENDLVELLQQRGVSYQQNCKVVDVANFSSNYQVDYILENAEYQASSKWVVDSTGRQSFLKRKFNLSKESNHKINAAWLHLDKEVNIDDWSADKLWQEKPGRGRRKLSTNHLMGSGYWVWIIPLKTMRTSIGIVADPRIHSFQDFNTLPKAMEWLKKHENEAYLEIAKNQDQILKFKVMKDFAFLSQQYFSTKRWALTGDAAAFMDPLYSPGLDFIGLTNTWISDLIIRDLQGQNIASLTITYEHTFKELLNGWILLYQDQYLNFGSTQVMLFKTMWDWATYWSIPCVMFVNNGYINLDVIKAYSNPKDNIGKRFSLINEKMQTLFILWNGAQFEDFAYRYCNLFSLHFLKLLQLNVANKYNTTQLIETIKENLNRLEQIASVIFWYAVQHKFGRIADLQINPYEVDLNDSLNVIIEKNSSALPIIPSTEVNADVTKMWFSKFKNE
jgi:flavin-dependent dehydrogenase